MEGFNSSKSVRIISDNSGAIGEELIVKLDISITYLQGIGGYTAQDKDLIYCVISRLELPKMLENPVAVIASTVFTARIITGHSKLLLFSLTPVDL